MKLINKNFAELANVIATPGSQPGGAGVVIKLAYSGQLPPAGAIPLLRQPQS